MGIYGALSTAVSGLRAQSYALENISGNIANSQTTGFKRVETEFIDLVPDAPLKRQVPGSVLAQSRSTNNVTGDIQAADTATFIALSGSGFFVVGADERTAEGQPQAGAADLYTRRGDFTVTRNGLLQNGAGYYLKGYMIDPSTGVVNTSTQTPIQINTDTLPARRTNNLDYVANLPIIPKTANYSVNTANSELLNASQFTGNSGTAQTATYTGSTAGLTAGAPSTSAFANGDTMTFNVNGTQVKFQITNGGAAADGFQAINLNTQTTIGDVLSTVQANLRLFGSGQAASATVGLTAGGAFQATLGTNNLADFTLSATGTAATSLGIGAGGTYVAAQQATVSQIAAQNETAFLDSSISGGSITTYAANGSMASVQMRWAKVDSASSGGQDSWQLFYLTDGAATGTTPKWTSTGTNYKFDSSGVLSPAISSVQLPDLKVNGVSVGPVTLNHGTGGITQFSDSTGLANVSTLSQDGYGKGEFVAISISDGGRVIATYSNDQQVDVALVAVAEFKAENKLRRLDGGVFAATAESGNPNNVSQGANIVGGALEASNTDISDEFTKLIVTQQAYSANTRIVSTADQMMQEALNMIR